MQAQNRVGQHLGNYRLIRLLGTGGYAEVYLAENIHLGVQAAIKVLKLRDLDNLEQDKFRDEARFMTTLEHPRIIKVLDYGIEMSQRGNDGSTPYLVMEYAPRGTLRHLYPHGRPMPQPEIVSYTKQIAEALQYAHDKSIIHRDVKPENMLVRRSNDVALSDFGIAVAGLNTSNLSMQLEEIAQRVARGEQIMVPGTAPYLAPERLQGHTQRASDQYSLAVIVYEWLCGKRPFDGSDLEICQKHANEPPPPLLKANPAITREIEQVVMKALSKRPSDRYMSVREFATALESAIQASAQPANSKVFPPLPPPAPVPPPRNPVRVPPSPTPVPATPPQPSPGAQQPSYNSVPGSGYKAQPGPAPQAPRAYPAGNQRQNQIHLPNPGPSQPGMSLHDDATIGNIPPKTTSGATAQPRDGIAGVMDEISGAINQPLTRTKEIFVSDKYFVKTKRTRQFRLIGTPTNVLAALIVLASDKFPISIITAILVGVISIVMLWRCTVSVKKPIALTFAAGVAICWGYAAASVASHIPNQSLEAPSFLLAFAISLCIHIWYIYNRLKN